MLLIPLAVGAFLSALPSAFQFGKAKEQKKLAKDLKEDSFIPPALQAKLDAAKIRANATLFPGQPQAEEQIREASAGSINQVRRTSSSTSDVLNTVAAIDAQEKNSRVELARTNAEFQNQADRELGFTQSEVAGVEQGNRDQFNASKSALIGASDQNVFNALSGVATAGTAFLPFDFSKGTPFFGTDTTRASTGQLGSPKGAGPINTNKFATTNTFFRR